MPASTYIGSELELFAAAVNWKKYLKAELSPYLGESVLEAGAGLGGTTTFLCDVAARRWLCLEPDTAMAAELISKIGRGTLPGTCETVNGTIADLSAGDFFDTILYIDVLEHIRDDSGELRRAAARLRPAGRLIVLSPAHQGLFSEFDRKIGHFRRYSKDSLQALKPEGLRTLRLDYLDSAGLLASWANRLLLRQAMPTPAQVAVWDRLLVPASRLLDPLLGRRLGKSVLAVWEKP